MHKPASKAKRSHPDSFDQDVLLDSPAEAAKHLDAILYFIHKRYSDSSQANIPDLGTFLITRAEVVFSPAVDEVAIEKRPDRRSLQIVTPPVEKNQEEPRRIFLLNEFAELIIKCQKQAYLQIREMLLRITDANGRDLLIREYEAHSAKAAPKTGRSTS